MKKTLMILFLLVLPPLLFARGSIEREEEYRTALKTAFEELIVLVARGDMRSADAREALQEIRVNFRKPYSDEFGIMESLLDQVEEKILTPDEALYRFTLLQNNQLMEFRQSQNRVQSGSEDSTGEHYGGNEDSGRDGSGKEDSGQDGSGKDRSGGDGKHQASRDRY